jgi:CRP-like cAMP-binding protein
LDALALSQIARRCAWREFAAEQQIVSHLDETNDLHFIISGRVRANVYSPNGRDVTFRDLDPGDMFGELAAIDPAPRSANCVALVPTTIATLRASEFHQVMRDHPAVATATLKRLVRLVRSLSDRVYEFSAFAVRNRIHAELLRLARDHMRGDNQATIDPAPTHAEIASRISTHREAVTRELNELARQGIVARDGHALVVRDVKRLARLVEALEE